jgi:hypothetical protein
MHPLAFQKLWKKSNGVLPHRDQAGYEALAEAHGELHDDQGLHYWGIVGQPLRYRGHRVIHCYNFGNVSVKFPWQAHLVNFGRKLPVTIQRSGTIRVNGRGNALLDLYEKPYLVFGFDCDATAADLVEPGMIISDSPETGPSAEYLVAMPDGSPAPEKDGVLFYYLMKRVPFTVQSADHWVAPGAASGLPAFRMTLQSPMLLEPGWPVLMLEKDRWMWGIVVH